MLVGETLVVMHWKRSFVSRLILCALKQGKGLVAKGYREEGEVVRY